MKTSAFSRTGRFLLWTLMIYSCSGDFLDTTPVGIGSDKTLADEEGINLVLTGAYAAIDGACLHVNGWFGDWAWAGSVSNWVFGSVASDDGTKGSDITDSSPIPTIEDYTLDSRNGYVSDKWNAGYEGIARTNDVLRLIRRAVNVPENKKNEFKAEALFLRAWFHFELKRVFNNIPFITEDVNPAKVTNKTDAWPLMETDMKFAADNLPADQADPGRPTKYAAEAVLARMYLFQHRYSDAKPLLDDIINSGKYSLMPNYDDNYQIATRNNAESIFEIQYAVNDGAMESVNAGWGDALNFPQNVDGTGTCCGFHQPTQNFVNAFKTDPVTGLPLLDTFNDSNFRNDMGIYSYESFVPDTIQTVDPRLDFSIGRRGIPYLDWGIMRGRDWVRDQGNAGPYVNKKNMFRKSEKNVYSTTTGWATGVNANNYRAYRLAHILLWRAEVAIEEGDLTTAVNLVNQVRRRAAHHVVMGRCYSYELPVTADQHFLVDYSKPAANYLVKEYPGFPDADYARKAVRHELRLEFGMEGHRHYDLVRWGIAAQTINAYMEKDREFRSLFGGYYPRKFTANRNEYWPIPQSQIELEGEDVLVQNPGY
jgi:starch-binding outer membrane protein, SusD/RagB family